MFNESHDGKHLEAGWMHPSVRNQIVKDKHNRIMASMPDFEIKGQFKAVQKVALWDGARSVLGGKDLPCFYQNIGSCTGQGKAKTEAYTMINQVLLDPTQKFVMPYEPYGYAMGRVCAGISGNDDGGTGSGCAEAATKYGVLPIDFDVAAEKYTWDDDGKTLNWPGNIDSSWGYRGAPAKYIEQGKLHPVKTTALLTNTDNVRDAIVNKYGVTCASNWGGQMKPSVTNGVLLNRRVTTWNHQLSVSAYWDHDTLGELFWIQNSWGWFCHGICPSGAPGGGFWVLKNDMQYICDQQEVFAYSAFVGFPADQIPWMW